MSLCILIHEATFFFTIPLMIVMLWFRDDNKLFSLSKTSKSVKVFSIPIIIMVLVCLVRGSVSAAHDIWNSWEPLFTAYPESDIRPDMGYGVAFLQNGFIGTAKFHLDCNFKIAGDSLFRCLVYIVSFIIALSFSIFLLSHNPHLNLKQKSIELKRNRNIGTILIIQFVAMAPMFTILSCDYGRTFPYCIVSSIFVYYFILKNNLQLYLPKIFSNKPIWSQLQEVSVNHNILWLYILVVLCFPIRFWGGVVFPIDCLINKLIHLVI